MSISSRSQVGSWMMLRKVEHATSSYSIFFMHLPIFNPSNIGKMHIIVQWNHHRGGDSQIIILFPNSRVQRPPPKVRTKNVSNLDFNDNHSETCNKHILTTTSRVLPVPIQKYCVKWLRDDLQVWILILSPSWFVWVVSGWYWKVWIFIKWHKHGLFHHFWIIVVLEQTSTVLASNSDSAHGRINITGYAIARMAKFWWGSDIYIP